MSKNLVNGDSLKKYHVGVNTPHESKVLVNEDVISFKVGTSNVTGDDYSKQMEQSIVTLDNIKGKSILVSDGEFQEHITINGIPLRSLNEHIYDECSNNTLVKKVSDTINGNVLNWKASSVNGDNPNSEYVIYWAELHDCPIDSDNDGSLSVYSNYFECNGHAYTENLNTEYNGMFISLSKWYREVRVKILRSVAPTVESFYHWMNVGSPFLLQYRLENPIVTNEPLNFLCSPGDVINTQSPLPFTCSHTVQLNTKAQVEELQNNSNSIWQKIKDCTDVKFSFDKFSYLKFPTIFGGLIIQWGEARNIAGEQSVRFDFPIQFKERFRSCQVTGQWNNSYDHFWTVSATDYKTFLTLIKSGNHSVEDNVYWFAIGK